MSMRMACLVALLIFVFSTISSAGETLQSAFFDKSLWEQFDWSNVQNSTLYRSKEWSQPLKTANKTSENVDIYGLGISLPEPPKKQEESPFGSYISMGNIFFDGKKNPANIFKASSEYSSPGHTISFGISGPENADVSVLERWRNILREKFGQETEYNVIPGQWVTTTYKWDIGNTTIKLTLFANSLTVSYASSDRSMVQPKPPLASEVKYVVVETDGSACMGEDKSRKQTELMAMSEAKRKAVEYFSTHITSETQVINSALDKDLISAFSNADVKIIKELNNGWYKDEAYGDCYRLKIKAEVSPSSRLIEKPASKDEPKQQDKNWVLWKKALLTAGIANKMDSKTTWSILYVAPDRAACEKVRGLAKDYLDGKDTGKEYYSDGTWGQRFYDLSCMPETIDPRGK